MNKENIKIVDVNIEDLKPIEINPRKWSKQEIDNLTKSIKRFGLVDPVICNSYKDRKNVILGGHFRWFIAKKLGYKTIPVVYINVPNREKENELCLRLNRNTGSWDYDLLKEFDISLLLETGFDDKDLSSLWDDVLEIESGDHGAGGGLNNLQENPNLIFVEYGDIYQLGDHKIMCGDSTNIESVNKLIGNEKISMLYCDPPYNIGLNYEKGISGKKNYGGNVDDKLTDEEYKNFLNKTLINGLKHCSNNCHIFYWCDEKYIGLVQNLFKENELVNKRVCLWVKNNQNPVVSCAFNKVYEPCVYATRGKPFLNKSITNFNEIFNKEIGTGNELTDGILDLFNIWVCKRLPGVEYKHPTMKMPELHERALRRCTKINDTVLDLFGGSGSTLFACDQLKRKCFLMEKEPIFIQLIINLYEEYANKKAIKLN